MVRQKGFTIIEMMIVVIVIAIMASIAYPSYQNHIKKTKRTDMMTELTAMGAKIEAVKLAKGSYKTVKTDDATKYAIKYPASTPLYETGIEFSTQTDNENIISGWKLTATPISGSMMSDDGVLTLDSTGVKCRATTCGTGNEWKD